MKIFCFANTNKDIANYLKSQVTPLIKHLIKIWLYPDVQENNHWKREVSNMLSEIQKLKTTKKYPNRNFILKFSWYIEEDRIDALLDNVITHMSEDPICFSYECIYNSLQEYFFWLAEKLSQRGTVGANDIYDEIESIRSQYFNNLEKIADYDNIMLYRYKSRD